MIRPKASWVASGFAPARKPEPAGTFASTTRQPEESKSRLSCTALMPGTTRSRLWRFTSTTHKTLPSPRGVLGERLPDIALVELGVTDERDEATPARRPAVVGDVLPGERHEEGGDGADPDGARREVEGSGSFVRLG